MLHIFIGFLFVLLVIATMLPVEIRAMKAVYRNIVLVWAQEVKKAWTE